jgi:hypothetical protein
VHVGSGSGPRKTTGSVLVAEQRGGADVGEEDLRHDRYRGYLEPLVRGPVASTVLYTSMCRSHDVSEFLAPTGLRAGCPAARSSDGTVSGCAAARSPSKIVCDAMAEFWHPTGCWPSTRALQHAAAASSPPATSTAPGNRRRCPRAGSGQDPSSTGPWRAGQPVRTRGLKPLVTYRRPSFWNRHPSRASAPQRRYAHMAHPALPSIAY